jgi:hypothetical protein
VKRELKFNRESPQLIHSLIYTYQYTAKREKKPFGWLGQEIILAVDLV